MTSADTLFNMTKARKSESQSLPKRLLRDIRALLRGPVARRPAGGRHATRRDPYALTVLLSRLSVFWAALMTLGKLALGLYSASVFLCLHAF